MKTAICFAGTARALEYTHENIKQFLLSAFDDYDIFMYIKNDKNAEKVTKYFCPTELLVRDDVKVPVDKINWDNRSRGTALVYMNMLHSRMSVDQMRCDYQDAHGFKYDCVVHSRLDVKYYTPLSTFKPEFLDMNKLYVPDFHNFPVVQGAGYNDRFAMSNGINMSIYFNLYSYVFVDSLRHTVHGESTLWRFLTANHIDVEYIPFRFSRVSEDGVERDKHLSLDPSCWQEIERQKI